MGYSNILSKNDRAIAAFIIAAGSGTADNILPAKRSFSATLPHVVVYSESANENPSVRSSFEIKTSIMVKSSAVDDVGTADGSAKVDSGLVLSVFELPTLPGAITQAARDLAAADPTGNGDLADYTCVAVRTESVEANVEEGTDTWVDTLNLVVQASPCNLDE